jgi:hypothetical protein
LFYLVLFFFQFKKIYWKRESEDKAGQNALGPRVASRYQASL